MDDRLLSGRHVLVVEDEMLVLMAIEDMCADLGCTSVMSAATVAQALMMIGERPFDLATLDLNLNGDRSYAVADALCAHGIPFAFSTGYGEHGISAGHRHRPLLNKPYDSGQLRDVMAGLLSSHLPAA